jgi:hypothetical protein
MRRKKPAGVSGEQFDLFLRTAEELLEALIFSCGPSWENRRLLVEVMVNKTHKLIAQREQEPTIH